MKKTCLKTCLKTEGVSDRRLAPIILPKYLKIRSSFVDYVVTKSTVKTKCQMN